jgi:DnaJ-domain-containing protein 1
MLAVLTWVASCDGRISPGEQALLDAIAASMDDREELAVVEAAVAAQNPRDLEIACRFLRNQLDRGGKRLLAQLAITMAIHDGNLTVGENYLLQFLADLLSLSPRAFARLFQQMAHRPFPQAGDPSSPKWWRGRAAGEQAAPAEFAVTGDAASADAELADEPMTRGVALSVLGLDIHASSQSIHAAYRRLAKTRHPDRFSPLGPAAVATATEAFKRLHDAYTVLSA